MRAVGVAAVTIVFAISPALAEDYLDTFTFQQTYLRRCIDRLRQVRESFIAHKVTIAGTGSAASESLWVTGCGNASDAIYNQLDQPSFRDEIEGQIRELGPSGFIKQTKAELRSVIRIPGT